jgi:hypothetical protein
LIFLFSFFFFLITFNPCPSVIFGQQSNPTLKKKRYKA